MCVRMRERDRRSETAEASVQWAAAVGTCRSRALAHRLFRMRRVIGDAATARQKCSRRAFSRAGVVVG